MMAASYMTKKQLKESIGQPLRHVETSVFGNEYRPTGNFPSLVLIRTAANGSPRSP